MDEKNIDKNAERLSDIISGILKNRGWETKVRENRVFSIWDEVVGDEIAKNSLPKRIDRGSLLVITRNPTWTQQLTMMKKKIIDKINKKLKDKIVKDIRFIQGEIPDKIDVLPNENRVDPPRSSKIIDHKGTDKLTKDIKDGDLREVLDRVLKKSRSHGFDKE